MDKKHQLRQKPLDFFVILSFLIFITYISYDGIMNFTLLNISIWVIIISCLAFLIVFSLKLFSKKPYLYIDGDYLMVINLFNSKKINISQLHIKTKTIMGVWRIIEVFDDNEKYIIYDSYYTTIDVVNLEKLLTELN